MNILDKEFKARINVTPLKEETVTVTGKELLSIIAQAKVLTPQLLRLKEGYENLDPSKRGFDEKLTSIAIAEETERLSGQITSGQILALEGVAALAKLATAWDEVNQLTFEHINQLQAGSPEYNKRLIQLQGQERNLDNARIDLEIFTQLKENRG